MDSQGKQSKKPVNGSGVGQQFQPSQSTGLMKDTKTAQQAKNNNPKNKKAITGTKKNNNNG